MKTKILSSILFGVVLLVLNGCSGENGESTQTDTPSKTYIEQNIVQNEN